MVPLRDGLVVFRAEDAPDPLSTPRIECRQTRNPYFGACLALELVFPMGHGIQRAGLYRIVSTLRREDAVAGDHTYGIGAWFTDGSHRSINYGITMPRRPEW